MIVYKFYTILWEKSYINTVPLDIEWMDTRCDRKFKNNLKITQKYTLA